MHHGALAGLNDGTNPCQLHGRLLQTYFKPWGGEGEECTFMHNLLTHPHLSTACKHLLEARESFWGCLSPCDWSLRHMHGRRYKQVRWLLREAGFAPGCASCCTG